jgi:hypothetical protein
MSDHQQQQQQQQQQQLASESFDQFRREFDRMQRAMKTSLTTQRMLLGKVRWLFLLLCPAERTLTADRSVATSVRGSSATVRRPPEPFPRVIIAIARSIEASEGGSNQERG